MSGPCTTCGGSGTIDCADFNECEGDNCEHCEGLEVNLICPDCGGEGSDDD